MHGDISSYHQVMAAQIHMNTFPLNVFEKKRSTVKI